MKNADEHKKLLAQIKELEKNSINYFDVEKEFFLIDSNNLSQVRPKIYGYSIQATGIYEDDNLTAEAVDGLDGRGYYIYVEVKDGKITIKQDLNGSWGIYLFRQGDYFALSNSFFRLLDHIKFKYPLTVNRDYCYCQVTDTFSSMTYSQTAVNEVRLIERNAIIYIDSVNKTLDINLIDYREHTVPLDSQEGVDTLDRWVEFWSSILREVAQKTKLLSVDLSGGFDSRMSFVHLLNSGIDLNEIRIYSRSGDLYTYKEDREIASKIADHYGFKLNKPLPRRRILNISLTDAFNMNMYVKQTVGNNIPPSGSPSKGVDRFFNFNGGAGETLRIYWHGSPEKFLQTTANNANRYYYVLFQKVYHAVENILKENFKMIRKKYRIEDANSDSIPSLLYFETRSRQHFGKGPVSGYFGNVISLSPAIDPEIRTLKLSTSECSDYNLLLALLFIRYAPDLLDFPFDSNHFIAPETIEYAKKINGRFPRPIKDVAETTRGGVFYLQPRDSRAEKILASKQSNPQISPSLLKDAFKAMFDSSKTFGLFTSYFDVELYNFAAAYYEKTNILSSDRLSYAITSIVRVLEDVEISQRNHEPYRDMQRFIEQDFATIHNDAQLIDKFRLYITARIDIKLMSTTGDFQIVSFSDEKAHISKPSWFNKDGIGYIIHSYAGELEIVAKAFADGQLKLSLRSTWVPEPDNKSKCIPYWINYTNFAVNEKNIFDTFTPTWHDKSYRYSMDVKAGEEIKINVKWLPHRSDT